MQTNLLWEGTEYYSLENCLVDTSNSLCKMSSNIIGKYDNKIFLVNYNISTNQKWETISVGSQSQFNNKREHIIFQGDGNGNWKSNGKQVPEFKDCFDIDIALTPFTNTLPINRLRLTKNAEKEIKVIYFDILEQQIKPVRQKYTRLSNTEYRFENVPNDFEAVIKVDEFGLVVDYPHLFVRTAIQETNYNLKKNET